MTEPLRYEEEIAYTQSIRKQIIAKKLEGGVPNDDDSIKILLTALKDHDTTTLSDRKNRIDESTAQSSVEIAQAMGELVKQQMNRNPFARAPDGSAAPVDHQPRALLPKVDEKKLGEHDLVIGEEEIGTIQEDSESFFNRMGVDTKGRAD